MITRHATRLLLAPAAAALAAFTLAACGTQAAAPAASSMADKTSMSDKTSMADKTTMADKTMAPTAGSTAAMAKGMYLSYADYQAKMGMLAGQGSKVVLFFHAPWCPDCRGTDAALNASGVPDGLVVVKVDYDSMGELKQKYGITQQHTFVQIDANGALVKKWSGAKDGAAIKSQLA